MASDNVDWDLPLPTPDDVSEDSDDISQEQRRYDENMNKLNEYVQSLAYRKIETVKAKPYIESLAKPKKKTLEDNVKQFSEVMVPSGRGKRLKRLAAKHQTITVVQLENAIQSAQAKERQKKDILKRKEGLYYELLTKLELQCQTQYLRLVLKKFGDFIAKLATTMRLPQKLFDPYARMQRGLFCNILQCIGVENPAQAAIYYNTKEGSEYAVCHKLSHALLSLIIKALDLSSTRNLDVEPMQSDAEYAMDNYIKDRLMRAAEKKIFGSKCDNHKQSEAD